MHTFGAGSLIGTPLTTLAGAAITNPSPIQFATLQDVTVDEEYENKMLYGAYGFPVDVGRGKGKVTIKAKAAEFSAELYNAFFYGVPSLTTGFFDLYIDTTGTAIPTTPYTITPTPPASGTYGYDLGVHDANGVPYMRVASGETTGQYAETAGVYTFAAADVGKIVYISYQYTASTPASARTLTIPNPLMGVAPFFQVDLREQSPTSQNWTVKYPKAMCTKIGRDFKNDDFGIPDIEITCFADSSGNISYQCYNQ